jgi:hypothetical protein
MQVDNVMRAGDKLAEFKLKKAMEAVNSGKAQVRFCLLMRSVRHHSHGN